MKSAIRDCLVPFCNTAIQPRSAVSSLFAHLCEPVSCVHLLWIQVYCHCCTVHTCMSLYRVCTFCVAHLCAPVSCVYLLWNTGVWTVSRHRGRGTLMLATVSHLAITMTHLQPLRYSIITLVLCTSLTSGILDVMLLLSC